MEEVREYYICLAGDARDLEKEVNNKLKKGWELQGGVAIKTIVGCSTIYQAVTRVRPKNEYI